MTVINLTYENGASINPVLVYEVMSKSGAIPIEVVPRGDNRVVCAYMNWARIDHSGRLVNRIKRSLLEVKSVEVIFGSSQ